MWGRLICIDYFQDFIFRLGIVQWVEKKFHGVLLISCKFVCKPAGTTKQIGKIETKMQVREIKIAPSEMISTHFGFAQYDQNYNEDANSKRLWPHYDRFVPS